MKIANLLLACLLALTVPSLAQNGQNAPDRGKAQPAPLGPPKIPDAPQLPYHFGARPAAPNGEKFGNIAAVGLMPNGDLLVLNRNSAIMMVEYDPSGTTVKRVFNPNIATSPHGMRIDRGGRTRAQEIGDILRQAGVVAGSRDAKAHRLAVADRIDRQRAAARDGLLRDDQHIQQKLDPVLRQQQARQIPGDGDLAVFDMTPRHILRVAEIDLRAGRSRRAERQAAELQSRRSGLGALANQVEREFAVFGFWIIVENLKPIDDGPHRTDEIMADSRT